VPAHYPALRCCRRKSSEVLVAARLNLKILWDVTAATEWDLAQHLLLAEWLDVMEMVQAGVRHISEKPTL